MFYLLNSKFVIFVLNKFVFNGHSDKCNVQFFISLHKDIERAPVGLKLTKILLKINKISR